MPAVAFSAAVGTALNSCHQVPDTESAILAHLCRSCRHSFNDALSGLQRHRSYKPHVGLFEEPPEFALVALPTLTEDEHRNIARDLVGSWLVTRRHYLLDYEHLPIAVHGTATVAENGHAVSVVEAVQDASKQLSIGAVRQSVEEAACHESTSVGKAGFKER